MNEPDKEVKTHFKGPGQWRSQAAELEAAESQSAADAADVIVATGA